MRTGAQRIVVGVVCSMAATHSEAKYRRVCPNVDTHTRSKRGQMNNQLSQIFTLSSSTQACSPARSMPKP